MKKSLCICLCFWACQEPEKSSLFEGEDINSEPTNEELDEESDEDSDDSGVSQDTDQEDEPEIEIAPCPDDVVCSESFPFEHRGDTSTSTRSEFDSYGCAPSTDESGSEIVYRFVTPHNGFLSLELEDMESGADVDIHLLETLDSGDCIDRGHWLAGAYLPAGEYWVVADTWVNSSGVEKEGSYNLRVGLTKAADLVSEGMDEEVAEAALHAFDIAWSNDELASFVYAITDFSLHSSQRRMWVYDLAGEDLLYQLHVAHGEGSVDTSDAGYASSFSNIPDSHQSSLGMMRAAESYTGSFGYSMRIDGLESYNNMVRDRFIVLHGWEGSRPEYVSQFGMVAPTWGCPAVDDREVSDLVDIVSDGSGLLFWYPDGEWSEHSEYLP